MLEIALRVLLVLLSAVAFATLLTAWGKMGRMEPWRARMFWGVTVFVGGFFWQRLHWLIITINGGPWEPDWLANLPALVMGGALVLVITALVGRR